MNGPLGFVLSGKQPVIYAKHAVHYMSVITFYYILKINCPVMLKLTIAFSIETCHMKILYQFHKKKKKYAPEI